MYKRKTVLFGWELGAGRGHIEHMRPVIERLLSEDWNVLAAVRNLPLGRTAFSEISPALREGRFALGQAPIFTHRALPPTKPPESLAGILAGIGFSNPAYLKPVLQGWQKLIEAAKPSLLLGDFCPSAVAAARGRLPVIMTGNGWCLPPEAVPLPSFNRLSDNKYHSNLLIEEKICECFSEVLGGGWAPNTLSNILRGDRQFVYEFSETDPYRKSRNDILFWPPGLPAPNCHNIFEKGESVIIYFPRDHPAIIPVIETISALTVQAIGYFGGYRPKVAGNIKIFDTPLDFSLTIPRSSLVIHHGGAGISKWCMINKKPQLFFPIDVEKKILASSMQRNHYGEAIYPSSVGSIGKYIEKWINMKIDGNISYPATESSEQTLSAIAEVCSNLA